MKNILDSLKSGNLGGLGDLGKTLNSALGGAAGSAGGMGQSLGSMGESLKNTVQNSNLGGVGGMLGSAAIGGLLGALFSGKGAAKLAKGALMVGGTAAAGALAWKFYQKWSQSDVKAETISTPAQPAPQGWEAFEQPAPQQTLPPAENTALILLEAMVFAARADGHIDDAERTNIQNTVAALFPNQEMTALLDDMLQKPIDPASLAAKVRTPEEAHDLYRLSCAAINIDSFMERSYLDGLAKALGLSDAQKAALEQEAVEARQAAAQ